MVAPRAVTVTAAVAVSDPSLMVYVKESSPPKVGFGV